MNRSAQTHGEIHSKVLGDYEVIQAREGFSSIRHLPSGEIMHSRTAPMEEAQNLYINQACLRDNLHRAASRDECNDSCEVGDFVIWDVGLGAGANAMAAITCYEELSNVSPALPGLCVVSFENDLNSLQLAFNHQHQFSYLRHRAPEVLLQKGYWESTALPGLRWMLVEGNFPQSLHSDLPLPDCIFYDLFSAKTHPDAWTLQTLKKLFAVCRGRRVELFTYTCSTAARAAMLAAGFYVARGNPAGAKLETTIALTAEAIAQGHQARNLLGEDWLAKWKRSSARFPADVAEQNLRFCEAAILQHPQFIRLEGSQDAASSSTSKI